MNEMEILSYHIEMFDITVRTTITELVVALVAWTGIWYAIRTGKGDKRVCNPFRLTPCLGGRDHVDDTVFGKLYSDLRRSRPAGSCVHESSRC